MKIIKLALRSILNFRMYSGVNLLGMALSLACVIIIFRYVYGEFSVDRFNQNFDRLYLTVHEEKEKPESTIFQGVFSSNRRVKTIEDLTEHPGVENFSHFLLSDNDDIAVDNQKYNASILVADSNFLKIIDYPVISGIHRLSDPASALITKNYAKKLFGNQNPVGKTFQFKDRTLNITGVIGQTATKSSLSFDVVISYHIPKIEWHYIPYTYVLLYSNVDYRTVNKQYESFFDNWDRQMRYQLFPLSKVYFNKGVNNKIFIQGNYGYVTVLMAIGILILLAGIVNYINIYTVVILRRGKELGIKKIFGAGDQNIFLQLLVESLLITGLAIISAFIIVQLANPVIRNVIQLDQITNIRFDVALTLVILLCLPLITTLYPFFRYRYSSAVNSIRNFDKIRSVGSMRRMFLSFQYVITIVLIIVSLFFVRQLQFMLNTDPGYRTKDIVDVQFKKMEMAAQERTLDASQYVVNKDGSITVSEELQKMYREEQEREQRIADEIVQKMNACPLFSYWTYGDSPNKFSNYGKKFKIPDGEYKEIHIVGVGESWLRLFEIPLKEGRIWDDGTDTWGSTFLIVTESVLKLYGITDINDAMLQPESWITSNNRETNPPYRIAGVVTDFEYLHLSQKSKPTAFYYSKGGYMGSPILASIVPGRTQDAIAFLRNLHDETVGGEFSYSFVEDEIREMYSEDKKIASIYSIFTFIAIFVSALGLLSMSLFDVQQRRKEIAIRKVNGATVADIIRLLLKKYFWSLTISFAIAAPIALLAINRYLEDFAHKATVSWWLFAVAVALTAGMSLLTLIYQTQKAANQNPAEVIKN